MKSKILETIEDLKSIIDSEVQNDSIDTMLYHSLLTRFEYIEELILNEAIVKRENECDCPESARMHMPDNEDDECTVCGKKY